MNHAVRVKSGFITHNLKLANYNFFLLLLIEKLTINKNI